MGKKVANQVIVPRICLKHLCQEYSKMGGSKLRKHFSNLLQVAKNSILNGNQPLTVSFIDADESIIIEEVEVVNIK